MDNLKKLEREFDKVSAGYKFVFVLLGLLILGAVLYNFWMDITTSYDGYGKLVISVLDGGEKNAFFGWVLAALPTLVQMLFWTAKVGDIKLADNRMLEVVAYSCTGFDCLMDVVAFYNGTIESVVFGSIITVVVFTLFSEMMFAWIAPVLYAMIASTFDDVMEESTPDAVRGKSKVGDVLGKAASANRAARQPIGRGTPAERMARIGGNGR